MDATLPATLPQVVHAVAAIPLYLKVLGFLGLSGILWKMVQGAVPKLLDFLMPLALAAVDAFVAFVQSYPLLRWFVIGDKDNFLKTVDALLDGLEKISKAVEERLKADLDAASSGQALPPPAGEAPPPAAPPGS